MAMNFSKSNNAEMIKNIQKKGIKESNNVPTMDIPLDEIDKNPENEKIFSMNDIESLSYGIKTEGFFGAIEVYKKEDGRFEISAGHRRYEAVKALGWKTIPCIVSDMPDDTTRMRKLISSNIRSRNLTPLDKARAIVAYKSTITKKEAKEQGKYVKQIVSEYFGMAEAQLYRYEALLSLIPELQEMANDPNFPFSAFKTASNLSTEGQKRLYELLQKFIEEHKEEIENKEIEITRVRIEQMINLVKKLEEQKIKDKEKKDENKTLGIPPEEIFEKEEESKISNEKNNSDGIGFETNDSLKTMSFSQNNEGSFNDIDTIDFNDMKFDEKVFKIEIIDTSLSVYSNEFSKIAKQDFKIKNKTRVEGDIKKIEEAIKIIKDKL